MGEVGREGTPGCASYAAVASPSRNTPFNGAQLTIPYRGPAVGGDDTAARPYGPPQ